MNIIVVTCMIVGNLELYTILISVFHFTTTYILKSELMSVSIFRVKQAYLKKKKIFITRKKSLISISGSRVHGQDFSLFFSVLVRKNSMLY